MSRVLTREEIVALLANGPIVPDPTERIRIGDPVEVTIDGETVAYGHLAAEDGRLTVRIHSLGKSGKSQGTAAGDTEAAEELIP
jgi:prophage tail gpP-like protein